MRILVLSQQVGLTAPGIVFERILFGLSKINDVNIDIVTCGYDTKMEIKAQNVVRINYPYVHYRLQRILTSIFQTDVPARWILRKIKVPNEKYDVILCLCSSGHLFGLMAGVKFKKKTGGLLACYLVDAVPAPLGWSKNNGYYRAEKAMIRRLLPYTDMLFSVNKEMLDYQLSLFKFKEGFVSDVLYPPTNINHLIRYEDRSDGVYRFLYTGNIYGLRNPRYVIDAFSLLYKEFHNVELVFVGCTSNTVEIEMKKYSEDVQKHVLIHPRTIDLKPFYEKSTSLIDIDADIDNDVFLSSKMSSYIVCNRPIICETGKNSPSRHLYSGIPSILQCGHDSMELLDAMRFTIRKKDVFDYTDRNRVLSMQSTETVSEVLYKTIKNVLNKSK